MVFDPACPAIRKYKPILAVKIFTGFGRILHDVPQSVTIVDMHTRKTVFQFEFSGGWQSHKSTARFRTPELIFAEVPLPQSEIGRIHRQTYPLLAFAQSLFLGYRFGDVHTRSDIAREVFLGVVTRHALIGNPAVFAIVTAQPVLHHERLPGVKGFGVSLKASLQIVRMHAFRPAVSHFLFQRAAGKLEPGLVEEDAELVHTRHPNKDRGSIGNNAKTRFTLT